MFAPRGIPHAFRIKSPVVRSLTVCTPSGFEEWFRQLGELAQSFELPHEVVPFSPREFAKMNELARRLDTEIIPKPLDL